MRHVVPVSALLVSGLASGLLTGCAAISPPKPNGPKPIVTLEEPPLAKTWQGIITERDQIDIDRLPALWDRARAAVPARLRKRMADEGALLDPKAAQQLPAMPPGPYHCRLVRLGGRAGFATFKPDFCYVDGDAQRQSFTKQDGENLPGGWLFDDGTTRQIFLGARRRSVQAPVPPYGVDPMRDVVGVVERVSPFRWRLVMPRAGKGALLDIYELVPVTPAVPDAPPAVPSR